MKFEKIPILAMAGLHLSSGQSQGQMMQTLEGISDTLEDYHKNCDKQDIPLPKEINGES